MQWVYYGQADFFFFAVNVVRHFTADVSCGGYCCGRQNLEAVRQKTAQEVSALKEAAQKKEKEAVDLVISQLV